MAAPRSSAVLNALRRSFGRAGPEGPVYDAAEAAPCVRFSTGVLAEDGEDGPSVSVPTPPFLGCHPAALVPPRPERLGGRSGVVAPPLWDAVVGPHPGRRRAVAAFVTRPLEG